MKITGPQTPGVPGAEPDAAAKGPGASDKVGGDKVGGTEAASKATGAKKAERSFAETLAAGRATPSAPVAPRATGAVDPLTSDIAAELKAGKLAPEAALDRVVERVLDKQLGANAPAALRDQVRNALRDTISSDPMIADRLRGLS
jgi:hypothetical protein